MRMVKGLRICLSVNRGKNGSKMKTACKYTNERKNDESSVYHGKL